VVNGAKYIGTDIENATLECRSQCEALGCKRGRLKRFFVERV
jgi:hypothetical protein